MYCCRKRRNRDAERANKGPPSDPFSFAMKTLKTVVRSPQPKTAPPDNAMYDYYEEPEYADDVEFSDDEVYDDYLVPEDTIERIKAGEAAPALPSAPIPTLEREAEEYEVPTLEREEEACYNDPSSMQLRDDCLDEGLVYQNNGATPDYPPREPDTPDIPKQDYKNLQDVPAKPQRRRHSSSSSTSSSTSSIIPIVERPSQPDYGNIKPIIHQVLVHQRLKSKEESVTHSQTMTIYTLLVNPHLLLHHHHHHLHLRLVLVLRLR